MAPVSCLTDRMTRPVAIFYHPDCLLHETGSHHPEKPERLEAVRTRLESAPFASRLHWYRPEPAPAHWIERVHSPEYRQFIEEACLKGKSHVDFGETAVSPESYHAACLAVGAAIGTVDAVFRDGYQSAFSLARPPGHHASMEKAMGFCLFNNIAIAARYAEETYGLERVCILDWDVHHGNGTQDIFYQSPSVLFCSIHQLPLYPHSGEFHETGAGAGSGLTVNCPLPNGSGIEQYMEALQTEILPEIRSFQPQLFLVSAGFDAHRDDPLADVVLDSRDFHTLTRWMMACAAQFTNGRLVSILEGGYHLDGLADSVFEHIRALGDDG
jgi:acetoin utilization deacetylase AcuC-like enzyme